MIAWNAARVLQAHISMESVSIIAGPHVRSLAEAIDIPHDRVIYFSDAVSNDVPAIFDARKKGVFSALQSLKNIRRQIKRLPSDVELVFDHLRWRQRLIGFGREMHGLPRSAKNIYVAYEHFFRSIGYASKCEERPLINSIGRAVIIPGARMDFRIIPRSVISSVFRELESRGIEVKVILLKGEEIDVPPDLAVEVIPRNFASLVSSIRNSSFVVSADSLPSHLSAFLNVSVFVFTPIPDWTSYWLPKSAFLTKGMATFVDINPFRFWLNKELR